MKKLRLLFTSLLLLIPLSACGLDEQFSYVENKINIVTTTTMLGDLASNIGGDRVNVFVIMKPGVNPHSYNPRPSDTRALAKADLVVLNGLHLEAKMGDVLLSIDEEKRLIASDILVSLSRPAIITTSDRQLDPHIWGSPLNWEHVARSLKIKLQELDSTNHDIYESNYLGYSKELIDLYTETMDKVEQLKEEERVLITAHDAFAYVGLEFGFEVHAIQGISTQTEASVKDIQDLANLVVDLKVKAIFVETSVPENTINSVLEAVRAQNHKVTIGGHLYSDSLGDERSGAETYIKMYQHNIDTIVSALKGA